MTIKGIENLDEAQLVRELSQGGRLVRFQYAISLLVITFRRQSDVHFIRAGEGTLLKSLPYTMLTLFLGWWGFPWGPIFSVGALYTNLTGGKEVTAELWRG